MRIEWSVRSIKDMRRLSPSNREWVIDKIEQYSEDPASLTNQVISLVNSDYLRLRVGNYRVIFSVENGAVAILLILRVRHRRESYD
ncbi:MAG: type II toxin-antitoxin system RelE/ParE family toxin [Chloroflexi bacterium]|nr:type II toxin-antitoxin system RelE/ParE family toxin [Chloroflexota bacterium]